MDSLCAAKLPWLPDALWPRAHETSMLLGNARRNLFASFRSLPDKANHGLRPPLAWLQRPMRQILNEAAAGTLAEVPRT